MRAAVLAAAELQLDQYHCYRAQRSTISTQASVVLASDSAISKTDRHRLSSRQAAGGQCLALIFINIKVAARPPGGCVVIFIKIKKRVCDLYKDQLDPEAAAEEEAAETEKGVRPEWRPPIIRVMRD